MKIDLRHVTDPDEAARIVREALKKDPGLKALRALRPAAGSVPDPEQATDRRRTRP